MLKKVLLVVAVFTGGLLAIVANGNVAFEAVTINQTNQTPLLQPKEHHSDVSRLVYKTIDERHYRRPIVNDDFSVEVFDKFLDVLDGNKVYFYQSDIEKFRVYEKLIDDALRQGELKPAYEIYQVFYERWLEAYTLAAELLQQDFDFTKKESYRYDREDLLWPKSKTEMRELWRKRVKNDLLNLVMADKDQQQAKDLLSKRYASHIRRIKQTKSEDVFEYYMNAYTQTVEPHTSYFSPRTAENFDIDMSLKLEGIGAVLQADDVYTKINELVVGGPAFKSKQLKVNDKIIGVGQGEEPLVDVVGWRLDDVVKLIRGKKGTEVRLEVMSGSEVANETKLVKLIRDEIKLEDKAAKSEVIDVNLEGKSAKVGVINIPKFYIDFDAANRGDENYRSTTRDVKHLITELQKQQVEAILIDLRNNGGGSLREAIELTGLFIDQGPVVQQRSSLGRVVVGGDEEEGIFYNGPLAVLVNGFSASASEIFAAAIQDYNRGLILGEQTYGKGTVQQLFDLNRYQPREPTDFGMLKYTTAKFYRVNGGSTQHKGVIPDISFPSAFDASVFGESSQKNALPWDNIRSTSFQVYKASLAQFDPLRQAYQKRIASNIEFQFLNDDIIEYNLRKSRKTVSLNKKEREQEKLKREQQELQRVNKRRVANGLEPVKSIKEVEAEQEKLPDFRLHEAANILTDYIYLYHKDLIANR